MTSSIKSRLKKLSNPVITIVGHVCIDHNNINGVHTTSNGSPLFFMADYLKSNHNINPYLLSPFGYDLAQFEGGGIFLNKPSSIKTLVYSNIVQEGNRRQSCANYNTATPVPLSDSARDIISKTDIFILAPLLPNYGVLYVKELLKSLRKDSITALLPQGYMREVGTTGRISMRQFCEYKDIIPYFDVIILSDKDLAESEAIAAEWSRSFKELSVIVTHNKRGSSTFRSSGSFETCTAQLEDRQIKHAVGAGDVFSISCLYNLHINKNIKKSVALAHKDVYKFLVNDSISVESIDE